MMEALFQDLRFGLRVMMKKPGFTAVAIITLMLGIGANTAIFSVVNAVLLRPLPYLKPGELTMFYFTNPQGEQYWFFKPAAYLNLKNYNSVFTDVAAWGNDTWPANLTGDGEPERLQGFQVSANLFHMLGVTAARGRTFMAEGDRPGAGRVVVISYDLWQRRFGGDPEIIGRPILLNGAAYDCIGVMPADFRFILKTDVWTTLDITPADSSDSNQVYFHQLARLKPGVSLEQARAETETLLRPYFNNSSEMRLDIKSFQAILTGSDRQMLFILLAAVSFVLLIACVNVVGATRGWKTYGSGDEEVARVYLPYQQENWGTMAIIVRAQSGDPMSLVPALRRELAAVDKDQPIYAFKPLSQSVTEISVDRRFSTLLLTAFAALASVLAAIGIYGVMSYAVSQRTREIGIRMALGADRLDVFKLIIGQGMRVVMIGLLLGLFCAIALTRWIESLLFEVRPTDTMTYVVIAFLLAGTSLVACCLPARKATKTDPMAALRRE